ncbi:MAG TPA: polysaccharide deacetylase family protein [Patescibacteria group bacterium]|nr:polysaccharide deacetylase family protein [Patescibacteria group bacterium]
MGNKKKLAVIFMCSFVTCCLAFVAFTVFFDQAVLVRRGTVYRVNVPDKLVALTFDDGPSPVWTPAILDELKRSDAKATFFMLGEHVQQYPEIARRVAAEGHEIENHSYDHHVLLYYKPYELEREVKVAENIIKSITGKTTRYFRPPKAWLTSAEKKQINAMGYRVILWSLNSKDWVTFDEKYILRFLVHHVRPGDIILFHDSGGVFTVEGGNRQETVKTIFRLVEQLRKRGYRCVTVSELLARSGNVTYQ